jgi:hypothetical protein
MTTTPCPNCGTPVELVDSASASATCPGCRAVVRRSSIARDAANWGTTSVVLKTQFGILLIWLGGTAVVLARFQIPEREGPAAFCVAGFLLVVYFLCLCMCGSAPDPTARRSALACVMTIVFGTIGLVAFAVFESGPGQPALPRELIEATLGFGVFAVYFSAFVFLMRFHATIARVFGNRRLRRQCYAYLFAPLVAMAVNFVFLWLAEPFFAFRQGPVPVGASRDLILLTQAIFNFAVVGWYAMIVLQTFRTIDRGPELRASTEDDVDELPID